MVCAAATLAVVACGKAEFKTANFVSFDSAKNMMPEACGIFEIPVSLHNAANATVTYRGVDGTAKKGVDYDFVTKEGVKDPSGVLNLVDGKAVIYVKVTDRTGELTKNMTFDVVLAECVTEGVVLGGTSKSACTIIDSDAGINLIAGSYYGEGKDTSGDDTTMSFDIDILDADDPESAEILEVYPNANLVFSNINPGSKATFDADFYGYFDENMNQVHIYGLQPFGLVNFTGLGEYYVGLGDGSWPQNGDDVVFSVGDGSLVADGEIVVWIIDPATYNVTPNGYYWMDFADGFELKQQD